MKKHKEFKMIANLCLDCPPELVDQLHHEIMAAIVDVVENHSSYVGGGFHFEEVKDA